MMMMIYETEIQPRFSETDALGHINNAVVPVWFEQARSPIFEIFVPGLAPEDWNLILARVEVDYLAELFYQSSVTIKTGIERVGEKSLTVKQEVWQKETLAAQGKAVLVYFDHKNKRSEVIPDSIKQRLQKFTADRASS